MALTANTVFEVRTTGNAGNGGGFDPSLGAAQLSPTDLVSAAGSTTVTSAGFTFTAGMVGSILRITAGLNFVPGNYRIATRVSNGEITVDRSPCPLVAGTGGTGTVSAGIDYSQQDNAQASGTDGVCATGTTTFTSASNPFTAAMVGNVLQLASMTGTGTVVGFYAITAYGAANSVTIDRTCAPTNDGSSGVFKVGGAVTIQPACGAAAKSDFLLDQVASLKFWFGPGTHTVDAAVSVTAAYGVATAPYRLYGYNAVRGDNPTGTDSPLLAMAAYQCTLCNYAFMENFRVTGTAAPIMQGGVGARWKNCQFVNSSTTANRVALLVTDQSNRVTDCEASSPYGYAFSGAGSAATFLSSLARDSAIGFAFTTGDGQVLLDCLITECEVGITASTGLDRALIAGCTFHGCERAIETTGAGAAGAIICNCLFDNCTQIANLNTKTDSCVFTDCSFSNCGATPLANQDVSATMRSVAPAFRTRTAWTDLACSDHAGPPFDVTSVAAGLTAFAVGDWVRFYSATGAPNSGNWSDRVVRVTAVAAGTISLNEDPTNGSDATGGACEKVTDYRPAANNALLSAGRGFQTTTGNLIGSASQAAIGMFLEGAATATAPAQHQFLGVRGIQ